MGARHCCAAVDIVSDIVYVCFVIVSCLLVLILSALVLCASKLQIFIYRIVFLKQSSHKDLEATTKANTTGHHGEGYKGNHATSWKT